MMFHVTDNIGHYTAPTPTTNAIAPSHPLLLALRSQHDQPSKQHPIYVVSLPMHCCTLLCIEEAKQNTDLTIKERIVSHHSS